MVRIRRKKSLGRAGVLKAALVAAAAGIGILLYFLCFAPDRTGEENLEQDRTISETPVVNNLEAAENISGKTESFGDDVRQVKYDFIKITERLQPGDYIDVRISFPEGADFIVLSKKKIEGLGSNLAQADTNTSESMWLNVTEEELLRMSSAAVDAYLNGCTIYAIEYLSQKQKEAVVNYPVNQVVAELIAEDPNIITKAKNILESRLRVHLQLEEGAGATADGADTFYEVPDEQEYTSREADTEEETEYLD